MEVNEVIIDFQMGQVEFFGKDCDGGMPILECPFCEQEAMKYVRD